MSDDAYLKEVAEEIRTLLFDANADAINTHFEVGKRVQRVKDDAKYGAGGVKELARLLGKGWKERRLYEAAKLYDKLYDIYDPADARSGIVTLTHLMKLSGLGDSADVAKQDPAFEDDDQPGWTPRRRLYRETVEQRLTVKELGARIAEMQSGGQPPPEALKQFSAPVTQPEACQPVGENPEHVAVSVTKADSQVAVPRGVRSALQELEEARAYLQDLAARHQAEVPGIADLAQTEAARAQISAMREILRLLHIEYTAQSCELYGPIAEANATSVDPQVIERLAKTAPAAIGLPGHVSPVRVPTRNCG